VDAVFAPRTFWALRLETLLPFSNT